MKYHAATKMNIHALYQIIMQLRCFLFQDNKVYFCLINFFILNSFAMEGNKQFEWKDGAISERT